MEFILSCFSRGFLQIEILWSFHLASVGEMASKLRIGKLLKPVRLHR